MAQYEIIQEGTTSIDICRGSGAKGHAIRTARIMNDLTGRPHEVVAIDQQGKRTRVYPQEAQA